MLDVEPDEDQRLAELDRAPGLNPIPMLPPLPQLRPSEPQQSPASAEPAEEAAQFADADNLRLLPQLARRRRYGTRLSFLICVMLPTALLAVYLWLFAADQYVSEFRFSVIQSTPVLPGASGATVAAAGQPSGATPSGSSLGSSSGGPTGPALQNFVIADYFLSPQIIEELQKRIGIAGLYQRAPIDWWNRFGAHQPIEKFENYFSWYFYANYDEVTGLAVARVRAFTPHDAWLIASTMAKLAEELVNRINDRANEDAIRFAKAEVEKAKIAMDKVNQALLDFRTTEGTINPTTSVVPTNTQLVQTQLANLASLQTQLSSVIGVHLDNGPVIRSLQSEISASKQQLRQLESEIAQNQNGMRALAKVVGKYEQLTFDQTYWQGMLSQTMQALELARANAAAQHYYLEPYVSPAVPESSTYPERPLLTLIVFLALFGAWLAGLLIVRAIQDHAV